MKQLASEKTTGTRLAQKTTKTPSKLGFKPESEIRGLKDSKLPLTLRSLLYFPFSGAWERKGPWGEKERQFLPLSSRNYLLGKFRAGELSLFKANFWMILSVSGRKGHISEALRLAGVKDWLSRHTALVSCDPRGPGLPRGLAALRWPGRLRSPPPGARGFPAAVCPSIDPVWGVHGRPGLPRGRKSAGESLRASLTGPGRSSRLADSAQAAPGRL